MSSTRATLAAVPAASPGPYNISWWRTSFGDAESAAAAAAVGKGHLSQGPLCDELEGRLASLLGVRHAILTTSGSTALMLAMLALGIGPGDEVIIPDITWIATAHGAALLGAKVVAVDCLPDTPLLDPAKVAQAITPRTKAILPVHLAGRRAPIEPLLALCRQHGIALVEDAAQALGSRHPDRFLGTYGDMGIYSLGVAKLVATGQGGFVVTDNDMLAEKLRRAKVHGVRMMPAEHYQGLGLNLKVSDVLAAIGLVQLDRFAAKRSHVLAVYQRYHLGLADHNAVRVVPVDITAGETPLWTEIRTTQRAALAEFLRQKGIETRLLHSPLHQADHLSIGGDPLRFSNATRLWSEMLILPSGPDQPLDNVDKVIAAIKQFGAA